jgi:hypothetical protein
MSPEIRQRYKQVQALGESVCDAMLMEVHRNGLPATMINPVLEHAQFELSREPLEGNYSLIGIWRDAHGNKQGEILFHHDGSFYAEYDVIRKHPSKPKWFIEAVTAWGNNTILRSELKLLPSVD